MIKYLIVFFHSFRLTVFKPSEDHRMCSGFNKGTFCTCGYGNDGVTFDEELERAVKSFDHNKKGKHDE